MAASPEVSEAGQERALAWEGARDAGGDPACARQTQGASLNPLHLLFAFDVSGSMGKGDKAWHDRALKWEPVVAATRSFFEEETARGLFASLTFFPGEGGEKTRCTPESYREPDVPMTALPDLAFGEAMDGIGREDWRGGTPTLSVLSGLFDQIEALRPSDSGRYVVVLVTDGHPQDCEDNRIEAVAELVAEHADRVPTYVIGVRNPPVEDAPDNTSDLADIAKAGGTEDAYLIDTGDPARTVARFAEAIDAIRGASVPCDAPIPPPPEGRSFDKTRVSVSVTADSRTSDLPYSAGCDTDHAWHYDDASSPAQIVLCPGACQALQTPDGSRLDLVFECEQVILGPL